MNDKEEKLRQGVSARLEIENPSYIIFIVVVVVHTFRVTTSTFTDSDACCARDDEDECEKDCETSRILTTARAFFNDLECGKGREVI